ncbi:MAG TPA: PilZ domain-containing protein, partial [Anaeromyxobacter sp.]
MAEFIVNPRRAPRASARCHAAVVSPAGTFDAETEDIGPRGCQVVSPAHVRTGDALEIAVTSDKVPEPLKARGKATWVSEQPPWRVGIAFDDAYVPSAERWFEKLVTATPSIGPFRRVPEKIAVEAMVYLGPPPRFLVDFSAEEAALLRAIASGARLDELMARLRHTWPAMQRALFSLLARQAVTLSRGHAAHPDAWKRILTEVEASLAVESLGAVPPTPLRAGAAPETTPMPMWPLAAPLPPPSQGAVNPAASPWGTPARDP